MNGYCIVEGFTKEDIELRVRQLMEKGWRPYGGVAITEQRAFDQCERIYYLVQAMVLPATNTA